MWFIKQGHYLFLFFGQLFFKNTFLFYKTVALKLFIIHIDFIISQSHFFDSTFQADLLVCKWSDVDKSQIYIFLKLLIIIFISVNKFFNRKYYFVLSKIVTTYFNYLKDFEEKKKFILGLFKKFILDNKFWFKSIFFRYNVHKFFTSSFYNLCTNLCKYKQMKNANNLMFFLLLLFCSKKKKFIIRVTSQR